MALFGNTVFNVDMAYRNKCYGTPSLILHATLEKRTKWMQTEPVALLDDEAEPMQLHCCCPMFT
jgi:hypothetical protein